MNIFEEVKAAVDINTAAENYGLNVRKDTALCPFHNEKTARLQVWTHFSKKRKARYKLSIAG